MDASASDAWITRAMSLGAESVVYGQRLLNELRDQDTALRARQKQVQIAKHAAELKRALAPTLECLLLRTAQIVQEIDLALRLQGIVRIEERTWQMGLACLHQQKRLIEQTGGKVRSTLKRFGLKNRIIAGIWSADWEERYVEVLDDLDDAMESIALGLSPKFRAELAKQEEAIRQYL